MTKIEFMLLCAENTVYTAQALEEPAIVAALKAKDDDLVRRLINELF